MDRRDDLQEFRGDAEQLVRFWRIWMLHVPVMALDGSNILATLGVCEKHRGKRSVACGLGDFDRPIEITRFQCDSLDLDCGKADERAIHGRAT